MTTIESIMSLDRNNLQDAAKALCRDDISKLVELLSLKDDDIRYRAFLMLRHRSSLTGDVYPYWDVFRGKLKDENSYQRSIGLMLLAENAKWDSQGRMADTLDDFLERLSDEKPITVRQCIQSLGKIAACAPELHGIIARRLTATDLTSLRDTMRKPILLDIINVLLAIPKGHRTNEDESFILRALSGDILDKKSKKRIEALWGQSP